MMQQDRISVFTSSHCLMWCSTPLEFMTMKMMIHNHVLCHDNKIYSRFFRTKHNAVRHINCLFNLCDLNSFFSAPNLLLSVLYIKISRKFGL